MKCTLQLKRSEILMVMALIGFAVAVLAVVIVVPISSMSMYNTIYKQTMDDMSRAAVSASQHIEADFSGLSPLGPNWVGVVGSALNTSREPPDNEKNTYGITVSTQDPATGDMLVLTSMGDYGGPASVLYHAERWTDEELATITQKWFWRLGGLGPVMAEIVESWNSDIYQIYCATLSGFSLLYPYYQMSLKYVDFSQGPIMPALSPEYDPTRSSVWTPPWKDLVQNKWIVTLSDPLYATIDLLSPQIDGYGDGTFHGMCGMDMYITDILSYSDATSKNMPWESYILIVSPDGTLLAIPQRGWEDWGDSPEFNYTNVLDSADYDPSEWNIYTSEKYQEVGALIQASTNATTGMVSSGSGSVSINGNVRSLSWSQVPGLNWMVITAIDEQKVLGPAKTALAYTISITCFLGVVLAIATMCFVIYIVVNQKYAKLNRKVHDLNEEVAKLKEMRDESEEDLVTCALTGGISTVTKAIEEVRTGKGAITEEQSRLLGEALKMLTLRNFGKTKVTQKLDLNQIELVRNLGIEVEQSCETSRTRTTVGDPDTQSLLGTTDCTHDSLKRTTANSFYGVDTNLPYTQVETWDFDAIMVCKSFDNTVGFLASVVFSALETYSIQLQDTRSGDIVSVTTDGNLLSVNKEKLRQFIDTVEYNYCSSLSEQKNRLIGAVEHYAEKPVHENMYHNEIHAGDATQAFAHLLKIAMSDSPQLRDAVKKEDVFVGIVAACVHDFRHPGRNNNFLENTFNELYVQSSGDATLERYHYKSAMELLMFGDERLRALDGVDAELRKKFISTVYNIILATDMAKHVEILDSFKSWVSVHKVTKDRDCEPRGGIRPKSVDRSFNEDVEFAKSRDFSQTVEFDHKAFSERKSVLLVLEMLMKAADLSNGFRTWEISKKWAQKVSSECLNQGVEESKLKIPVSKINDGSIPLQTMQVNFLKMVVVPLLREIARAFPSFKIFEREAWANIEKWQVYSLN